MSAKPGNAPSRDDLHKAHAAGGSPSGHMPLDQYFTALENIEAQLLRDLLKSLAKIERTIQ